MNSMDNIKELADAIYRDKVRVARSIDPAERIKTGLDLYEYARSICMAGIQHQFPDYTEEQRRQEFTRRIELRRYFDESDLKKIVEARR